MWPSSAVGRWAARRAALGPEWKVDLIDLVALPQGGTARKLARFVGHYLGMVVAMAVGTTMLWRRTDYWH